MERVLPSTEVKARLSSVAIGLAADCDDAESSVDALMRTHLPDARTLPFAAFLTPDGTWVDGFSGYKEAAQFAKLLAQAEQSPLLDATPAVREQLAKPARAASEAAARRDWNAVLRAVREAGDVTGRCAERDALRVAEKQARDWVAAQFDDVVRIASSGGDLAPARKRLADVKKQFAGEPEADDADVGRKALLRLTQIRAAEARPNPAHDLRERAAAMFEGSRWAAVFAQPGADAATGGKGDKR